MFQEPELTPPGTTRTGEVCTCTCHRTGAQHVVACCGYTNPKGSGEVQVSDEQLCRQAYSELVQAKRYAYRAKQLLEGVKHQEQRCSLLTGMEQVYQQMDIVVEHIKRQVQIS